ncbi:MAG: protein kinase [Vicinamibacteria bacterium]|nr:protein kinase [Vicinamibacteria bacterium]
MAGAAEATPHSRPRVGRYVVTGRLGKGGMGMVYRGLDEALEREVAVKTLHLEGSLDDESRRRFEIEAKAAARLQHPNIVTVYELGESRGTPFIAMELLPGMDLEALLRSGEAMLLQEKLEIVIQVLRGLAFAHEHGIVHRDMKPSNIRLLEDGTAKIMDFGIAKLGATGVTRTGMMVGTVYYMSPEQIRGRDLDGRSDVFSMGVILHEMLEGKRPFGGKDAPEILYKIVNEPHPPLGSDLGDFKAPLQAIVDKALAKDPDQRWPNAARLADELQALLAEFAQQTPGAVQEAVQAARRLSRDGRLDESARGLREIAQAHPSSVEARRALRSALRDLSRHKQPPASAPDSFPELEATFGSGEAATARHGEPTATSPAPVPTMVTPGRGLLLAGGIGLAVAVAAGGFLLFGGRGAAPQAPSTLQGVPNVTPPPDAGPAPTTVPAGPARPAAVRLPVESEPAGATVALDGSKLGTTPLTIDVPATGDHKLVVTLAGHEPYETRLAAGKLPEKVTAQLEPAGPPGTLRVTSAYPVDVVFRGRSLARNETSPTVKLPQGRHSVTLVSEALFLRHTVQVEIAAGGEASLRAPEAGKLSVNANPDNCEVFVDGTFVDYPPILNRAMSAGKHTVAFKWPDGTRREQTVEVPAGSTAYVTGRKD